MKLGIGSYSFPWAIGVAGTAPAQPLTARGLIAKALELNVRVIQFGPNLKFDRHDCQAARQAGLEVEIGAVSLDLEEWIKLAADTGAQVLRTVIQEEAVDVPPLGWIEKKLRSLVKPLEETGLRLALENSVVPAAQVRAMLDNIGHPALGVTLDTANSLAIGEGWREVLEELAPYTYCLHVKDYRVVREWHRLGFRVVGTPAGQGLLDIPALLDTLRRAGSRCNAILELWCPEQATLAETIAQEEQWVQESIQYLRFLIRE